MSIKCGFPFLPKRKGHVILLAIANYITNFILFVEPQLLRVHHTRYYHQLTEWCLSIMAQFLMTGRYQPVGTDFLALQVLRCQQTARKDMDVNKNIVVQPTQEDG